MSKQVDALTNAALVRRYNALNARWDKVLNRLVEDGLGDLRPSDMRAMRNPPTAVRQWIEVSDLMHEVRAEADRRYGPGLVTVSQLTWRTK